MKGVTIAIIIALVGFVIAMLTMTLEFFEVFSNEPFTLNYPNLDPISPIKI